MTSESPDSGLAPASHRPPVDLRSLISSNLMDQGSRPVCLPFAVTHAHDAATKSELAPEAIWWRAAQMKQTSAGGMLLEDAGAALGSCGQPSLISWPWNPTLGWDTEPPPSRVGAPPWRTATLRPLDLAHDGEEVELENSLADQHPVVLVIEVTEEFSRATGDGIIDVPDIRGPAGDYHAVLVVGAKTHADRGRLLLVRNSWTTYWGSGGFGWLPVDYLIAHALQAATVTL